MSGHWVLLYISEFLKLDVWEILSQRNVRCARVCAETQLFQRRKAASQEICLSFIDLEVYLRFWIGMCFGHFNAKWLNLQISPVSAVQLVILVVAKLNPDKYLLKENMTCIVLKLAIKDVRTQEKGSGTWETLFEGT